MSVEQEERLGRASRALHCIMPICFAPNISVMLYLYGFRVDNINLAHMNETIFYVSQHVFHVRFYIYAVFVYDTENLFTK